MEDNILTNCGVHTDRLTNLANKIKVQRFGNGETINQKESAQINFEIYEAYQEILSNLKDGQSIEKAILYLEKEVERNSGATSVKGIAEAVSKKVVQENEINYKSNNVKEEVVAAAVTTSIVANQMIKTEGEKVVENVFDYSMLKKVDVSLEKAKLGDEKSITELEVLKKATIFMGKFKKLDGKLDRGALVLMGRLSKLDSPAAEEVLEKMAKQYESQLDVFDIDENGKKVVNEEKLQKMLKERLPEEKFERLQEDSFERINKRTAKRSIDTGIYDGEKAPNSAEEYVKDIKKDVSLAEIRKKVKEYSKDESGLDKIKELYAMYPDKLKEVLKEKIHWCNRISETGRGIKALPLLQKQVMMISEAIPVKEKEFSKDNQDIHIQSKDNKSNIKSDMDDDYIL